MARRVKIGHARLLVRNRSVAGQFLALTLALALAACGRAEDLSGGYE